MIKKIATIGMRLKKEKNFEKINPHEKEKLIRVTNELKGMIWSNILAKNLKNYKFEGEEIATLFSFSGDNFKFYMADVFLGEVELPSFSKRTGTFYIEYIPYMNKILKSEGIKIVPQFTEYPVIFKIILL